MLKMKVPELSCGSCARSIENAVKRVAPDARVEVDLAAKTVTVDAKVEDQAVIEAVAKAGFRNEKLAAA